MDAAQLPEANAGAASLSTGAALAAAREAKGLTVEDIASQLKLSVTQVKAIEADDHDRLPSPVFARGFIRSYARLVKLDLALAAPVSAAIPSKVDAHRMQYSSGVAMDPNPYRRVPMMLGIVACVLLGLAYYEFVLNVPRTPAPPATVANAKPETPIATAAPPTATAEPAADASAAVATTPPAVEPLTLKKSGEPANNRSGSRGLHFMFKKDSWVEVRDGDGKIVFSSSNASGTEKLVQGDPPLSVVVGAASGVQLTYNGSTIDLSAYSTDDVARLRLE
jgi:cytoskeleton protein RodZ